ncbi:fasciclin domain-containing protein [Psychroflexus tropicus]|uniref:fasciclin domain-containing protein n=1 Tax=Psychroflexus tropicus TaxID=197345 RepID=UPI00035F1235|nr:fasciclin domain-containing protein [Psychroflexus tropicus]
MDLKKMLNCSAIVLSMACLLACNTKGKADTEDKTSKAYLNEVSTSKQGQAFMEDDGNEMNALKLALTSPDHTTLVKAVQEAEVENALVNVGPLTVFAPTNAAFNKIDKATLEDLLKPEHKSALAGILVHHVAPSNYPLKTLQKNVEKNRKLYMADGQYLDVTTQGDDIYIGGTKIIKSVNVSNGWVHIIEEVLLPN